MSKMHNIVVNRQGLRWSNEFGWACRPFDIFVGLDWNLPHGEGRWEGLSPNEPIEKNQTKNVRIGKSVWELPMVLPFWTGPSGILKKNWHFYDAVAYRKPEKGEFYVSGAIPEVYKAPNDLPTLYLIVVPTERAIPFEGWTMEEA